MLPQQIIIPQYIRKVKVSEKQNPVYWVFNGKTFKAKGRKLPKKYIKIGHENQDNITAHDLAYPYKLIYFFKGKYFNDYFHYVGFFRSGKLNNGKQPISPQEFTILSKQMIYNRETEKPVIANLETVGTPKWRLIRGQDFYSGNVNEFLRNRIMIEIKESFKPYLKHLLPVKEYPIIMWMELHDTVDNIYGSGSQRWDIDNRSYPYCKAFPDLLTELEIIDDDDRLHITQPPVPIFYPVEKEEDRKLVFIIEKDDRPEAVLLQNKLKDFKPNKKANLWTP